MISDIVKYSCTCIVGMIFDWKLELLLDIVNMRKKAVHYSSK